MKVKNFDQNNQAYLSTVLELYPTQEQINRIMDFIQMSNFIYDLSID